MEMKVRGAAGVVVALVSSATVPVWSQETPPVKLEIFHCDTMDEQEVQRIFAAELGARLASEPRLETTQVIVECMGDRSLLRVRDPITRKGLSRAIALRRGEPEAHARLVAIAATELVLASWSELKVNPEPKVEPEGPEVSDAVVEAALRAFTVSTGDQAEPPRDRGRRRRRGEPPPSELRLLAIGSLRGFKEHRGLIWGGGVRAAEDLSDTVSGIADTASDAKDAADNAKSAADAAKTSADEAKTVTSGLTTLVYGAIGASLVAALAAIVSLMQISRRIAG